MWLSGTTKGVAIHTTATLTGASSQQGGQQQHNRVVYYVCERNFRQNNSAGGANLLTRCSIFKSSIDWIVLYSVAVSRILLRSCLQASTLIDWYK